MWIVKTDNYGLVNQSKFKSEHRAREYAKVIAPWYLEGSVKVIKVPDRKRRKHR